MRLVILFCLLFGSVATLWGQPTEVPNETDLARSYYSAIEQKDKASAQKVLKELTKRFPADAITQLVKDHWQQQVETPGYSSWKQLSEARRRKNPQDREVDSEQSPLIVMTYAVADLVVPIGPKEESNSTLIKNAKTLGELIQDSCLQSNKQEAITFHEANLALVVRGTEKSHQACQKLLTQLRVQQDIQLIYEITLASVEPKIANAFSLRESISPAVFNERLKLISESDKSSLIMAPKITLFNDQIASIETSSAKSNMKMELHGKAENSLQSIRTEFNLSFANQLGKKEFKFATSEVISDGQTATYFIKTEDSNNSLLDRRLLIEKGMQIEPSKSNQLFLFLTPKILIAEEEEVRFGANNSSPRYAPVAPYPEGYPYYPQGVPLDWTPVKLNWDDGAWDFNWPSPAIKQMKHEEKSQPDQPIPSPARKE